MTTPPITTSSRTIEQPSQEALIAAIHAGVAKYFAECRARVPSFVSRHFCYPGAWRTNRHGLGWDMLRSPLNLLWVPFYLAAHLLAWGLDKLSLRQPARLLRHCPVGLRTRIQQYLMACAERDLLLRDRDDGESGSSRLRECIVEAIVEAEHLDSLPDEQEALLEKSLNDALAQYALTRTANADISNTIIATIAGAFTLQKFTPGGIAIGFALAGFLANRLAAWNFFLGQGVGQWYYALFPVTPGIELVVLSTLGVMLVFAVLACFSGLLSDPVQALLGIHQRRLYRMLDALERDIKASTSGSFRPKDAYLARLMDIIDAARQGVG
ncbi:hypothetical protein KO507_05995 [Gilvimarinus agarilyticus]|uniref:DUF6635 family protein n=1 Tax=unclassified Gilvimarinus TaxID=2642066 RepID=UPI001C082C1D|nr:MULTISPECIES: DUF6635 family protein [unclassified Gilvimarinus]MBU2885313.1 hypothetical protein [Gilvimarinus agarilyticus]MDO6570212.1 hypothetical protein [Gilvimarinus sp. 2_MG-2023]MDO6748207.1 hypothetical protein [Gilvimarinus sp. 1_MG-2023]